MIILHVRLKFPPDTIAPIFERVPAMTAVTLAEDGCIAYQFARDALDPDTIRVTECWASEDHLARHMVTDHVRAFSGQLPKVLDYERRAYVAEPTMLDLKPALVR